MAFHRRCVDRLKPCTATSPPPRPPPLVRIQRPSSHSYPAPKGKDQLRWTVFDVSFTARRSRSTSQANTRTGHHKAPRTPTPEPATTKHLARQHQNRPPQSASQANIGPDAIDTSLEVKGRSTSSASPLSSVDRMPVENVRRPQVVQAHRVPRQGWTLAERRCRPTVRLVPLA